MWKIDKTIDFCYGHRVWTQTLDGNYADDLKCACRHIHGHEGKVQIFLQSDELDVTGMVTDFRHLEWLKKMINEHIDHQFIIDRNDPLINDLFSPDIPEYPIYIENLKIGSRLDLNGIKENTPKYEYLEGFLIVDFVPTSENLSKWMYDIVNVKMNKIRVDCTRVDWWETPRSRSSFRRGN